MILIDRLTTIADSIRSKTGGTEKLTLDQIASEIIGLSGSVGGNSGGSMFSTTAVGILPVVYKGTASSEFSLSFESSAVGALSE